MYTNILGIPGRENRRLRKNTVTEAVSMTAPMGPSGSRLHLVPLL
jgi:hypothetical protein